MEFSTALLRAWSKPPPRLMFADAGWPARWSPVTQSTPAITWSVVPLPEQSSTRTATNVTPLAIPYVAPPTVPDTCVPCPLQSSAVPPGVDRSEEHTSELQSRLHLVCRLLLEKKKKKKKTVQL